MSGHVTIEGCNNKKYYIEYLCSKQLQDRSITNLGGCNNKKYYIEYLGSKQFQDRSIANLEYCNNEVFTNGGQFTLVNLKGL